MAEFGSPCYDDDDIKAVLGCWDVELEPDDGCEWMGWSEAIALGMATGTWDFAPHTS